MKAFPLLVGVALVVVTGIVIVKYRGKPGEQKESPVGDAGKILTTYRQIPVRSNGDDYTVSHGKHYADDGYYYGQKWQCVEFVKRFYHDAFNHHMPDVWGHANDFYDPETHHGTLNAARGMIQYLNGETTAPEPDDLLVFSSSGFGHVAVISAVRENEIEVVQQNVKGRPRDTHPLTKKGGRFIIGTDRKPIAWLRLPPKAPPVTPPREPAP